MRTLERTVLVLVFTLLAGCGQQLVEFANPSIPTASWSGRGSART